MRWSVSQFHGERVVKVARLLTAMGAEVPTFNRSACLCPTMRQTFTQRWPNCETWWSGRKACSGARRSAAARWPAS